MNQHRLEPRLMGYLRWNQWIGIVSHSCHFKPSHAWGIGQIKVLNFWCKLSIIYLDPINSLSLNRFKECTFLFGGLQLAPAVCWKVNPVCVLVHVCEGVVLLLSGKSALIWVTCRDRPGNLQWTCWEFYFWCTSKWLQKCQLLFACYCLMGYRPKSLHPKVQVCMILPCRFKWKLKCIFLYFIGHKKYHARPVLSLYVKKKQKQ